jgi:hypothetical protein
VIQIGQADHEEVIDVRHHLARLANTNVSREAR